MKIGIIGSGNVGGTLARGLVLKGHEVMLGTRDPVKPSVREFVATSGGRGSAGTYAQAARFADIVITAYPGALVEETVAHIGPENLDGKVVLDAANGIRRENGQVTAAYGEDDSAAEVLQRAAPGARVVKAYNTMWSKRMPDPTGGEGPMTMRIAGDDPEAKEVATAFLESTGWRVRDLGGLERSRKLEHEVLVWAAGRQAP